jgi:hypothetical protein
LLDGALGLADGLGDLADTPFFAEAQFDDLALYGWKCPHGVGEAGTPLGLFDGPGVDRRLGRFVGFGQWPLAD